MILCGKDAPLEAAGEDNELMAYQHHGFWKCMDACAIAGAGVVMAK